MTIEKAQYYDLMRNFFKSIPPLPLCELKGCLSGLTDPRPLKLLLVNTPGRDFSDDPRRGSPRNLRPPVGLYSLKSSVESQLGSGSVAIIDMDKYRLTLSDIVELLAYLNKEAKTSLPVGLNISSANRFASISTAQAILERFPQTLIIFGGRGATLERGLMVKEFNRDFSVIAVLGEGEIILPQILKNGWSGRMDIVTHMNVDNPPSPLWLSCSQLTTLPPPEIPPLITRYGGEEWYYVVLSSRSCPHRCNFCAGWEGSPYRQYPAEYLRRIIEEIPLGKDGKRHIYFIDDNPLGSTKRAEEILSLLEGVGGLYSWRVFARGDIVMKLASSGFLDRAKNLGLEEISIGVESLSSSVLRRMGKKEKPEINTEAVAEIVKREIRAKVFTMIGYDGEELGEIQETIDWLRAVRARYGRLIDPYVFIATPFFGTPFYEELIIKGLPPVGIQLYGEAIYMEEELLREAVDRGGIRVANIPLGELWNIASSTQAEIRKL